MAGRDTSVCVGDLIRPNSLVARFLFNVRFIISFKSIHSINGCIELLSLFGFETTPALTESRGL